MACIEKGASSMANYICAGRSNYFQVADEEAWQKWLGHVCGVEDFSYTDEDGVRWHGFGCYDSPWYDYIDSEDGDDVDGGIDCDASIDEIQSFIADGHALIYREAGWEKLRYVSGWVMVVTKDGVKGMNIVDSGLELARVMLGDDGYSPEMCY